MTETEKIEFVQNITSSIASEIINKIKSGAIPEDWDGIELREILAEKFSHETHPALMRGKRKSEYKNTCIVKNI